MKVATFVKNNGELLFITLFLAVTRYSLLLPKFYVVFSLGLPGLYSAIGAAGFIAFVPSAVLSVMYLSSFSLISIYFNIPTLAGTWYFNSSSVRSHALAMTACAAGFAVHPVGSHVAWYTVYWIIPVVISAAGLRSLFFKSLGTVFVMHAVGTVCWLYTTISVTPAFIIALAPRVLFERIALACVMTLIGKLIGSIKQLYANTSISTIAQNIATLTAASR